MIQMIQKKEKLQDNNLAQVFLTFSMPNSISFRLMPDLLCKLTNNATRYCEQKFRIFKMYFVTFR